MKKLTCCLLLAFTLNTMSQELPDFEGDYTFVVTGDEIALDGGSAKISKDAEGKTILSLRFGNRNWEAPFEVKKYEPKPGHARRFGIPPYFDVVFVAEDGDFKQTLILSGELIDGNLKGQIMSHRGISTRYKGKVFRVGTFLLKPDKKLDYVLESPRPLPRVPRDSIPETRLERLTDDERQRRELLKRQQGEDQ